VLEHGGQARSRLLLGLVCLALASCDLGDDGSTDGSPTESDSVPEHVEIHSSLDGFAILPRRIAWTGTTSLPDREVREMLFLLDGERLWRDPSPPLPTAKTALSSGHGWALAGHRFTLRVVATDGSRESETVIARVQNRPTAQRLIERGMRGLYQRLSGADLERPPPPGDSPRYTADLWIGNSRLLWIGRSSNHAFAYEYWVRGHSLYLGTPFFSGAPGEVRPAQGWGPPELSVALARRRPSMRGRSPSCPDGSTGPAAEPSCSNP
jgi:hypothetical protein